MEGLGKRKGREAGRERVYIHRRGIRREEGGRSDAV